MSKPKHMYSVSIVTTLNPAITTDAIMFICPTVNRAKDILNESGHIAGREGNVNRDTGWQQVLEDMWVARISSDGFSRYVISKVEYKE